MENSLSAFIKVKQISENIMLDAEDQLAVEEPLEIRLLSGSANNRMEKNISVTMRTPGNDDELAAGFLFTEGIIKSIRDVQHIEPLAMDENIIRVMLHDTVTPDLQQSERNFYTTSSCGVCGKSSIEAIITKSMYPPAKDAICLKAALFFELHDVLRKQQVLFETTGGLHASALFSLDGNFILLREDVGRHNALDKLIGATIMHAQLPLDHAILLLSGRASFELVQKATMAGIKIVAAVGAPSSLAVQLAIDCDITLIGFLRNKRFNIYSGWQRVEI